MTEHASTSWRQRRLHHRGSSRNAHAQRADGCHRHTIRGQELHISLAVSVWILTSYTVVFGGMLLLGGRIADYLGRKRVLIIGLISFALAAAAGRAGGQPGDAAHRPGPPGHERGPDGPADCVMPSPTPNARSAAGLRCVRRVSGGGSALGLSGWRRHAVRFVARDLLALIRRIVVLPLAIRCSGSKSDEKSASYDVVGAITATVGVAAVVYGFTKAQISGWGSPETLLLLIAGAACW